MQLVQNSPYHPHGVTPVTPEEFAINLPLAMDGDLDARNLIGRAYLLGEGGHRPSVTEARKWLSAAASHGHPRACYNLALSYLGDNSSLDDIQQALHWAGISAREGFIPARYIPALVLFNSLKARLLDINRDHVMTDLKMAVDAGFTPAMVLYARMLLREAATTGDKQARRYNTLIEEALEPVEVWQVVPNPEDATH